MKRALLIILSCIGLVTCKKENKDPQPVPETPAKQYGTVTISISTFDSLGQSVENNSGARVSLMEKSGAVTTSADGKATFNDVPYGNVTPVVIRHGYEGAPFSNVLSQPQLDLKVPLAQFSYFSLKPLQGQVFSRNLISLSLNLQQAVPASKFCKIAVYTSTAPNMSHRDFRAVDIVTVTTQNNELNVVALPQVNAFINTLDSAAAFYIGAVPVSYGIYESNLVPRTVLLGRSVTVPGNLLLKKTWKK